MIEILLLSGALLVPSSSDADQDVLRLPAVIGDSMVLQRDRTVALWGWDRPGQDLQVRADWLETGVLARAGEDGRWQVSVKTPGAGGPHSIEIQGSSTRTLSDVLIGEVWICSGQSNMEWPLERSEPGYDDLPDHELDRKIRLFEVTKRPSAGPLEDCAGEWSICSQERSARFSAVGYFFARDLVRELDVPVGLIGSYWGGTLAEAWTSQESLEHFGEFSQELKVVERFRTDAEGVALEVREQETGWWKALETLEGEAASTWTRPGFDDAAWSVWPVPGRWDSGELASFDGSVWFRTRVELPSAWAGEELKLSLGPIDDLDQTWFNGEPVGSHEDPDSWRSPRNYVVPGRLVRAGDNQITVRVIDTAGHGGIYGTEEQLSLVPSFEKPSLPVSLAGDWRYRSGAAAGSFPRSTTA